MTSGAKNECVLQQRFAKAHSLGVGDVLTVSADGRKLDLTITGLGVMPEFVMVQRGNELITPAGPTATPAFRRVRWAFCAIRRSR
jgi:hypothetical protein